MSIISCLFCVPWIRVSNAKGKPVQWVWSENSTHITPQNWMHGRSHDKYKVLSNSGKGAATPLVNQCERQCKSCCCCDAMSPTAAGRLCRHSSYTTISALYTCSFPTAIRQFDQVCSPISELPEAIQNDVDLTAVNDNVFYLVLIR